MKTTYGKMFAKERDIAIMNMYERQIRIAKEIEKATPEDYKTNSVHYELLLVEFAQIQKDLQDSRDKLKIVKDIEDFL